ncbi:MAG: stage II sporulation protein P [Christensenellales bacterium]|jgi:stage II sporulation protein P
MGKKIRIKAMSLDRIIMILMAAGVVISLSTLLFKKTAQDGGQQVAFEDSHEVLPLQPADTVIEEESDKSRGGQPRLLGRAVAALLEPGNLLAWELPAIKAVDMGEWQYGAEAVPVTAHEDRSDILPNMEEEIGESVKIEIEKITDDMQPLIIGDSGPQILIYHTHTQEAYLQMGDYKYVENGRWRTKEQDKNVCRVGRELAQILQEKYGFSVIHDVYDHEPPKLGTSYERSLITMEKYKAKYPSIQMFIDVHRDAYDVDAARDIVMIDGKAAARMMFVVGTGEGKTGNGPEPRPNWQENYKLALKITNRLNEMNERFCRKIRVKTGRYNQHLTDMSLLVEVGHNANTLEEALTSVPYLAEAINDSVTKQTHP